MIDTMTPLKGQRAHGRRSSVQSAAPIQSFNQHFPSPAHSMFPMPRLSWSLDSQENEQAAAPVRRE